jgi:hypothetical protein
MKALDVLIFCEYNVIKYSPTFDEKYLIFDSSCLASVFDNGT